MTASNEVIGELLAALKAAAPYVQASARHHERLGLVEEAEAAWATHRRIQWALRAAGADPASRFSRFEAED